MGRSTAGAAVGVAEENSVRPRAREHFYGQYFDLDFLAGFSLLGFGGTTSGDTTTSLVGFIPGSFCFCFAVGFITPSIKPFIKGPASILELANIGAQSMARSD